MNVSVLSNLAYFLSSSDICDTPPLVPFVVYALTTSNQDLLFTLVILSPLFFNIKKVIEHFIIQ